MWSTCLELLPWCTAPGTIVRVHTTAPVPEGTTAAPSARARGGALRWWLTGLLGLVATLVLVTQVPRLWGVEGPWEHAAQIATALAPVWCGVLWSVRRQVRRADASPDPYVPGVAGVPVVAAPLADRPDDAVRRARRRGRWGVVRQVVAVAVLPLLVLGAVHEVRADARDARLLGAAPVRAAVVEEVVRHPLDGSVVGVFVELDGQRVRLDSGFPEEDDVRAGGPLDVVVHPADPGRVVAASDRDAGGDAWWGTVIVWLLLVLVLVPAAWLRLPRPAAVRAALAVRSSTHAQVEAAWGRTTLLWLDGQRWTFTGARPAVETVLVLGDVREGAWVVVDDGRTRLPSAPLGRWYDDEY